MTVHDIKQLAKNTLRKRHIRGSTIVDAERNEVLFKINDTLVGGYNEVHGVAHV